MERLWAPWRMQYIRRALAGAEEECFLCHHPGECKDEENLILHRGRRCFVILNRFPYNPGHLMAVPYAHVARLSALPAATRHELLDLVSRATDILQEALRPAGFNIGLNLGRTAGAGLDKHLHFHIVPRWDGDNNFMPVVADTRIVNAALGETYRQLRPLFARLTPA